MVPRRPGLAPPTPVQRRSRSFGMAMLVLVGLAIGAGVGVAVQMDRWPMPWPRPWSTPFADVEPSAGDPVSAALEPENSGLAPDETTLTEADMVQATPAPLLEEGAGGPLVEDELDTEAGDTQALTEGGGREVAAADRARLDIAPLFIGRIYVHYSADGDDEERRGRALQIARDLEQRGYRIAAVRPVDFAIQSSNVRYFFDDDLAAAARLQEDLPATVASRTRLMDFTSYEPRPRPGTIELWLDGSS